MPHGAGAQARTPSPRRRRDASFGGLVAVDVDHVEIQRGTITALIGPNGAGKTTFFNLLTGFDRPNEGKWTFEGRQLAGVRRSRSTGWSRSSSKALSRLDGDGEHAPGAQHQRGEKLFPPAVPVGGQRRRSQSGHCGFWRVSTSRRSRTISRALSGGQRKLL